MMPGYSLDERELHWLEEPCVCAHEIARLDARVVADGAIVRGSRGQPVVHPAIEEARLLRVVQLRLLSALDLGEEAA